MSALKVILLCFAYPSAYEPDLPRITKSEEQSKKALPPMCVTLLEIVTLDNDSQAANIHSPILVMPFGIVMLVNDSQLENA